MIKFWEPAVDYKWHKSDIDRAIQGCIERGELVLGYLHEIETFESSFASFIGVKHAIMCGSGTQALHLAYQGLGFTGNWKYLLDLVNRGQITLEEAERRFEGDEVITTAHTFIATIDQIVAVGAKPVLVDIDGTGLIDPELIRKAITPRTKGIVPVHLEGKVCNMPEIMEIARQHGLFVVEDAAQAIGAEGAGRSGHASCFSLYPAKILGSLGNAGVVVTNDDALAEKLKGLRCNYNIGRKNKDIETPTYGHNFEPDPIQAAVLNVKLEHLPENLRRREEVASMYDAAFEKLPIGRPLRQKGRVYQDYVVMVDDPERFAEFLKERGIETIGVGLVPNHFYKKLHLNYELPKTVDYLAHQVRLPCNPNLTPAQVEEVIMAVQEFYTKHDTE